MGEAKRKEAILRQALLVECDLWDVPASQWEADAVEEIRDFPIVRAVRAPADQLRYGRMLPRECHANSQWYAQNDPTGTTEQILGWWLQGDLFVLHSVIRQNGQHICITPQEADVPAEFFFVPDAKIGWEPEGEFKRFVRDGQAITAGLRSDPAAHRAAIQLMRERVLAGMKPRRAMELADEEAMARLGIAPQRHESPAR